MRVKAQPFRERLKEAAVDALIEAAEQVLTEKGFDKATMQDIADRAGCAVGTLYVHFKNKEELFRAIVRRRFGEVQMVLARETERNKDPLERLRAYVEIHLRWTHEHLPLVNLLCSVLPMRYYDFERSIGQLAPQRKERIGSILIETLKQAQKAGQVRRDISAQALRDVLDGFLITLIDQFSAKPDRYPLEEQLRIAWEFIVGGISGGRRRG